MWLRKTLKIVEIINIFISVLMHLFPPFKWRVQYIFISQKWKWESLFRYYLNSRIGKNTIIIILKFKFNFLPFSIFLSLFSHRLHRLFLFFFYLSLFFLKFKFTFKVVAQSVTLSPFAFIFFSFCFFFFSMFIIFTKF